jgi:hypothetical protein
MKKWTAGKSLNESLAVARKGMPGEQMNGMGDIEAAMANMRAMGSKANMEDLRGEVGSAVAAMPPLHKGTMEVGEAEGEHGSMHLFEQLQGEGGENFDGEVDQFGEDAEEEDPEDKKAREAQELRDLKAKADGGCLDSMNELGDVLRKGKLGLPESPEIGAKWYQRAAKMNHADAMYNLALCHYSGTGVQVDDKMCHALLLEATKQGHGKAMSHLAQHYLAGQGSTGKADFKEGVRWLRKAATAGDKTAQFNLGNVYYHGQYGVKSSNKVAKRWFQSSAEQVLEVSIILLNLFLLLVFTPT